MFFFVNALLCCSYSALPRFWTALILLFHMLVGVARDLFDLLRVCIGWVSGFAAVELYSVGPHSDDILQYWFFVKDRLGEEIAVNVIAGKIIAYMCFFVFDLSCSPVMGTFGIVWFLNSLDDALTLEFLVFSWQFVLSSSLFPLVVSCFLTLSQNALSVTVWRSRRTVRKSSPSFRIEGATNCNMNSIRS